MEAEIEKAKERKGEIEALLATADYTTAQEFADELRELSAKLERDMERWSELTEI